jgi:fimbrial chaperone protein
MNTQLLRLRWLMLFVALASTAQAVTISPIRVDLSSRQKIASVTINNDSNQAMSFQAETMAWTQVNGSDSYQPTQDLLISPVVVQIPAKSSQVFRVALRQPLSGDVEKAYRLMLEDVSEVVNPQPDVVAVHFRHNLPVYVTPEGEAKLALRWSRCKAASGKGCVRLANDGNSHVRFLELTVGGNGWQQVIKNGVGASVLAGSWKEWIFSLNKGQNQATSINAKTDQGSITADLSASPP